MEETKNNKKIGPFVIIAAVILVAAIIWTVRNKQPAAQNPQHSHTTETSAKTDTPPTGQPKLTLKQIIQARRYWGPILTEWNGKMAPDFTVTDINGKLHKLSGYRGKNVLIVLWATWCGYCKMEVPHNVALRNAMSQDDLAILAISFQGRGETEEKVKVFAEKLKMNYTVISADPYAMPKPYTSVQGLPSAFFIDKKGWIKLATSGPLSFGEKKAIILAE